MKENTMFRRTVRACLKHSLLLSACYVVVIYMGQKTLLMPLVADVASSEMFLLPKDSEFSADRRRMAFSACHGKAAAQNPQWGPREVADGEFSAWDIGAGYYLVRWYPDPAELSPGTGRLLSLCKVRFLGGDETDDSRWQVESISISESS